MARLVILLSAIAAFTLVYAGAAVLREVRQSPRAVLKRRLHRLAVPETEESPEELRIEKVEKHTSADRFLLRSPLCRAIAESLLHAGSGMTVSRFLLLTAGATAAFFTVGFVMTGRLPFAALFAVAGGGVPYVHLHYRTRSRARAFTAQLPDALSMITRSLRAGHSLAGAIELVGQEMDDPARELFKTAFEQQKLGLSMTEGLAGMAEKIDSMDLQFFVAAVSLNSEIGGNLTDVLDKLAVTIRDRLTVRRQVRVHTAQGRMSASILAVLPVATFFLFNLAMPGYVDPLIRESTGQALLLAAAGAQAAGFFLLNRITNVRM